MSSEYGSIQSQSSKQGNSSSSLVYGIGNRKSSLGNDSNKTSSKTKLFFNKFNITQLEDIQSPRNKSEDGNGLIENFMQKKSSSSSEKAAKKSLNNSESSISSANSIIHVRKTSSVLGMHTFHLKRDSVHSMNTSQDSMKSTNSKDHNRSSSRTFYVEENIKINDSSLKKSYGKDISLHSK